LPIYGNYLTHNVHTQTYHLATQQCFKTCAEVYNIGDTYDSKLRTKKIVLDVSVDVSKVKLSY
jgi:hypothetical protein